VGVERSKMDVMTVEKERRRGNIKASKVRGREEEVEEETIRLHASE
jgi:hypothetical protein